MINNNKGSGLILSCVLVLVFAMFIFVMCEESRSQMTASGVRDGLESVATNISILNSDSIYQSQREGYFTSNVLENDKWKPHIDIENLDKFMEENLGTKKENNVYVKRNKDGKVDFKLADVKVNVTNPNLAPNEKEKNKSTFTVEITGDLEINKMFSVVSNSKNIKVNVGSKVGYMPKF